MERVNISRLDRNRSIYLQLGFIVALILTILAFDYTAYDYENPNAEISIMMNELDDVAVIRTAHERPRQLPPPIFKVTEDIIVETEELIEELPLEAPIKNLAQTAAINNNIPAMHFIVDKALPPPPPPPAEPQFDDTPFIIVEKMPLFGDCIATKLSKSERKRCSDRALMTYLASQIRYPALARENNITGTAVIQFVINKNGAVTDAKIIRDLAGGCGKEALRVIKNMPNWIPGQQRTQKVKVRMTLPIKFQLQGD
ncbi:MAG: energy transducer TonB [Saprospiraceae bacterium]